MKVSEQLNRLRDDRAKAVTVMETIYTTAERADRIFTGEEQKQFDGAKAALANIDTEIENAETIMREQIRKATPITAVPGSGGLLIAQPGAGLRELIRSSGLLESLKRSGERMTGGAVVKALIGGAGGAPALAWNVSNLASAPASFGSAPLAGSLAFIVTVDGGTVLFNRVKIGSGTAAKQAPEGSAKAHVVLTGEPQSLPVATYAAWEKVSTQALVDVEQLIGTVESILRGAVNDAISADVYAVANTAGNHTVFAPVAGEVGQDAVLRAAAAIAATGATSVAVALNPADLVALATLKATTSGVYLGAPVAMPPIVQSAAVPVGQLLASATDGSGLCFGLRADVAVSVGLDGVDFTSNLRTVLCEARGIPFVRAPARVLVGPLTAGAGAATARR